MALVDYSSEEEASEADSSHRDVSPPPPPAKRPRPDAAPPSSLPPLPPAFYDLYAATVRQSRIDDPDLHQGRRRQVPHMAGRWPSHLYVEWHPSPAEHASLARLLDDLQRRIGSQGGRRGGPVARLASLLVSDLGAPQPLHVSLSRPLSLTTRDKDAFLRRVVAGISSSGVRPFRLRCTSLEWHSSPESSRSFLVLRVRAAADGAAKGAPPPEDRASPVPDGSVDGGSPAASSANANPQLTALLERCNAAADAFGQPALYQWAEGAQSGADDARVGAAFHVSIAWSSEEPDPLLRDQTAELLREPEYAAAVAQLSIPVDAVKAKIGNVVTHIPLPERGKRALSKASSNLFGL